MTKCFSATPRRPGVAATAALLAITSVLAAVAGASPDPAAMEPGGPVVSLRDGGGGATPPVVVGTGFTYQGQLKDGGSPANGVYDLQFQLYDAADAGTQIGVTVTVDDIAVADGRFTIELDFGAGAFGGGARWLAISVKPGASGAFTALTPRQKLTGAPYALTLPNVYTDESIDFVGVGRDFRISGNEVFGIRHNGLPNQYGGMYVETSDPDGWPFYGYATNGSFRAWTYLHAADPAIPEPESWQLYLSGVRLKVPATGGLRIGPASDYSLVIENTTGADGIRILDTGDDAIQIGSPPDVSNYGVYIPSPGVSTYGLWPNTASATGEWALYTVDNIQAGNVFAAAQTIVARVNGPDALQAGDVVAAAGVGDPVPGSTERLALVRLAGPDAPGIVGVVHSRMVWEIAPGKEAEGERSLQGVEGAARDGDYVALVVLGVADVRVERGQVVARGARVTAADTGGRVRALRTESLNGMPVAEGAQVVGIALEAAASGADTVPVFVTLK